MVRSTGDASGPEVSDDRSRRRYDRRGVVDCPDGDVKLARCVIALRLIRVEGRLRVDGV